MNILQKNYLVVCMAKLEEMLVN